MKWFKFWKKSGPNQTYEEDYFEINDSFYKNKEEVIKAAHEQVDEWIETTGDRLDRHYCYGFEEVENPPKEWLKKEIEYTKFSIKEYRKNVKRFEIILKSL